MTLPELIKDLQPAMEQTTDEWYVRNRRIFVDDGKEVTCVGELMAATVAQSIAIRHNTAPLVLQELTALDERRTHVGKSELVVDQISELFPEDTDLVPAIAQQTKDLEEANGWWHFANEALCLLPGMDWDADDCESLVPNAKRCIDALTRERDTADRLRDKADEEAVRFRNFYEDHQHDGTGAARVNELTRERDEALANAKRLQRYIDYDYER